MQPSRTNKKCWHKAYISKTMALYETYCASIENSTDTVFCIIVFTAGCPIWNFPKKFPNSAFLICRLVNLRCIHLHWKILSWTPYTVYPDHLISQWISDDKNLKHLFTFTKKIKNSLAIHSQNRLYRHSTLIQRICNYKMLLQFFQCICRVENTFLQFVLNIIPRDIFRITS